MDFEATEEERAVRDTFHRFAEREVRPRVLELDVHAAFPRELFLRVGELGLFAMRYPEPEGSGASVLAYCLALEELAWGSLTLAASCTMQSLMGTYFVGRFAPPELRARLFLPALRGERVGAICMTEPEAGSDLLGLKTRAEPSGDGWAITGGKTWVTSAPVADFFTVLARTGEKSLGFFLVERGAPGLTVGRHIDKLGLRASPTSEVYFEAVRPLCQLGAPEGGLGYLRELLVHIRVATAALALGIGRAALEDATAYARDRRQFGKAIGEFQAVQAHLADMATELPAARQLTHWAAWRSDRGLATPSDAAMAKLFASETAARICDRAARVAGSAGFAAGASFERYLRDVRFTLLGGGTSEILRSHIGKELL
ncbi:MAG: acyl-CoA dehydrogenase family protein [Myxococcales bacterium]|nr:acyl-CoA dehydrogenase family protein [Myxococcales bacterium]